MKKLLAILLSMLMLCTLIPFAAVSAEDATVVIETEAEVNAGDEFEVTVNLANNPGVISAIVEILYDHDVFELVATWDEDEEAWMYPIEIGTTFKAQSNKHITFGPLDTETGVLKKCSVGYMRGDATSNCTKEWFFTATFKVKDDAVTGDYSLALDFNPANFVNLAMSTVPFAKGEDAIVHVNGTDPEPDVPSCEHEYTYPCDKVCSKCYELTNEAAEHNVIHAPAVEPTCTVEGNVEYWYCEYCGAAWLDEAQTLVTNPMSVKLAPSCKYNATYYPAKPASCFEEGNVEFWHCEVCDVFYADADCTVITNALNVKLPVSHNVIHVPAAEPTCTEEGNIEYWYCDICGSAWLDELCHLNTNLMAVKLAPSCKYNATYYPAKPASCFEEGNVEFWHCETCDVFYADADCTVITNAMNVIIPISHNVVHVPAAEASCTAMGNIEYWYCDICGSAWLDEYCHLNTNLMAVKLPMAEHTYDNDFDVDCNVCGAIRVMAEDEIIIFDGNSVSENKNGLAFKFDAKVAGLAIAEDYVADYANAKVYINGEEYKLIGMGAVVNNKGLTNCTLDDQDGNQNILDIKAEKVVEFADGSYSYFIRILNIPEAHLDTVITARSYYIYENEDGESFTVYGADTTASYNQFAPQG